MVIKNQALSGDNEVKKMSMLRRQVWLVDDDKFEQIVKNSQRVLKLNDQYKNHPYVEEFTKERSVFFVYERYVLEGETDAKFPLGDIWNLRLEEPLQNNASNVCMQMINCMRAWNYLPKTSGLRQSTEIIRQAHRLMMDGEKDVLAGEYRKSLVFAGYHIFAPACYTERYMEDAVLRFHGTEKDDPNMAATNLFGNIINIHSFENGNGRIYCLILAHVLIQIKCCLFPVILSSFHRRGRRHYIRAVKMFDRKPSMLYTIIVKSLIHCWDNFEQNARMPAQC